MARYYVDYSNSYLGKYRRVGGATRREAKLKAQLQLQQWEEQELRAREREAAADAKAHALTLTLQAEEDLGEHREILASALRSAPGVDWQAAFETEPFGRERPSLPLIMRERNTPQRNWLLELLRIRSKQGRISAEALATAAFEKAARAWEEERRAHERLEAEHRREVEAIRDGYPGGEPEAVASYLVLALGQSDYPNTFPPSVEVLYDHGLAVIELDLPRLDEVPHIAHYRYDGSRYEISAVPIGQGALADLYDGLVYQTVLRTLHEVFACDEQAIVERATVNLFTTRVNSATGLDERICLATCEAERERFTVLDLSRVDAKDCFRALNGLVARRPSALNPVQPLRTIEATSDAEGLAVEVAVEQPLAPNLLEIDPFEFEELVGALFRRLFEREQAQVEVTQASHDGGVDVVVVDPDQLKGGKTVIQVKRYRGVVPPGFVRELYGTMLNEGAARGILVATAEFGPEAYAFAQDKPITLIDANALLQMLSEYGYRYRINGSS